MENQMQAQNEPRDIKTLTTEIKTLVQQAQAMALMYAIEIGRRLKVAKSLLPHGEWGEWLKSEVNFSQSSANRFMRVFEEYGDRQMSLFGVDSNSSALTNLPITKALQLIAIPEEEREAFVKENDVEHISTRELDEIIKERVKKISEERDQAVERAERAEESAGKADEAEKQAAEYKAVMEKSEKEAADLNVQLEDLKKQLEKSKAEEKKARDRVKELKDNPVIPQEMLDSIKSEAEAKASEEITKQIQAKIDEANEKIDAVVKAKRAAEEKAKEAAATAESLRKKLEMSNPDIIAFKTLFEQTQDNVSKMQEQIKKIRQINNSTADKLNAALGAFIKQCEEGL